MGIQEKEAYKRRRALYKKNNIQKTATRTYTPPTDPGFLSFVTAEFESIGWDAPTFMGPYGEALEGAVGGDLREVIAAPPQHGKTEVTLRAFLYWAKYRPGKKHAYVTYNDTRGKDVAKMFQRLAAASGFEVGGTLDVVEIVWNENGVRSPRTFVKFSSVKGDLTGYALTGVGVVDDPIKNAADAHSKTIREAAVGWYKSVLRTRRHKGTSIICMATRWHMEDLSGFLLRDEGFHEINLKCIAECEPGETPAEDGTVRSDPLKRKSGESLWPQRKPPEFFAEEMSDAHWWASMYQGQPRAQGTEVFGDPTYYTALPDSGYRVGFGLDLAYSRGNKADWSVMIRGVAVGPVLYVTDLMRVRETIITIPKRVAEFTANDPGAPVRWYGAGQEKAIVQNLRKDSGVRVKFYPAKNDKFVRASPVAAAWNNGRVLLPAGASWLPEFLGEVCTFTGGGDTHDDMVDALAALFDEVCRKGGVLGAYLSSGETPIQKPENPLVEPLETPKIIG